MDTGKDIQSDSGTESNLLCMQTKIIIDSTAKMH